jgi:hypothetical protein
MRTTLVLMLLVTSAPSAMAQADTARLPPAPSPGDAFVPISSFTCRTPSASCVRYVVNMPPVGSACSCRVNGKDAPGIVGPSG